MKTNSDNSTSEISQDTTPDMYSVTVRREKVEGEMYFVGRVGEFPDIEVFEDTHEAAYAATLTTLTDLIAHMREEGIAVPEPFAITEAYSGRVTFRMTKSLHRLLDRRAKVEGVSINALLQAAAESYVARNEEREHRALDESRIEESIASAVNMVAGGRLTTASSGYCVVEKWTPPAPAKIATTARIQWSGEGEAQTQGADSLIIDDGFQSPSDDSDRMHRHFFSTRNS